MTLIFMKQQEVDSSSRMQRAAADFCFGCLTNDSALFLSSAVEPEPGISGCFSTTMTVFPPGPCTIFLLTEDESNRGCVVSIINNAVGWIGLTAFGDVQGLLYRAQNAALRGTSADGDCGGVLGTESDSLWAV